MKTAARVLLAFSVISGLFGLAGCTSSSTHLALSGYHKAEAVQQSEFDMQSRMAQQTAILLTVERLRAMDPKSDGFKRQILDGFLMCDAIAQRQLNFAAARSYMRVTAGAYLYDQQGLLNILGEELAGQGKSATDAATAASAATGVSGQEALSGLLPPTSQPDAPLTILGPAKLR